MAVLYRKYRPQTFADIIGQPAIAQTLRNAVSSDSVAHAYLFTGSRGVGKTSAARILAKAVNCLNRAKTKGDACGTCAMCTAIADGALLDLVEIDAASNTGVDNVRELIEHVKFSPARAQYKVFIIDEVHMLSKAAFNALLKTLEEPPAHAIFILATTDIEKVPETIISRTQRFDFRRISEADILELLSRVSASEKLKINEDVLQLIAVRAQGGLRDALSLLGKLSSLGSDITVAEAQSLLGVTSIRMSQDLIDLIIAGSTGTLPGMFDELLHNGTDFLAFNRDILEYLRKLLVRAITGSSDAVNLLPADAAVLDKQAAGMSVAEIMRLTRLFLRSYKESAGAPTPDLPLLLAALEGAMKAVSSQSAASAKPSAGSGVVIAKPAAATSRDSNADSIQQAASTTVAVAAAASQAVEEPSLDSITMEEITVAWPAVIEKIRGINSPLATLVKNSPIQSAERSSIVIGVKYLFHKEHLESKKHYAVLSNAVFETTGKRVRVIAEIVKDAAPEPVHGLDAISDALKVFGGELVE